MIPFIIPGRAALPASLPVADGQRESLLRETAHFPTNRDYFFQGVSAIQIVALSGRGTDRGVEAHQKDDVRANLKGVSCQGPIDLRRPRRVANNPIHLFSIGKEVPPFGYFAPV